MYVYCEKVYTIIQRVYILHMCYSPPRSDIINQGIFVSHIIWHIIIAYQWRIKTFSVREKFKVLDFKL